MDKYSILQEIVKLKEDELWKITDIITKPFETRSIEDILLYLNDIMDYFSEHPEFKTYDNSIKLFLTNGTIKNFLYNEDLIKKFKRHNKIKNIIKY